MIIYDFYRYSGATILASAKWIKDNHNSKQLIIAVPFAPREILEDLNSAADKVIVLYTPEPFGAVRILTRLVIMK
jgi:predicted phosphoribosyltransferase